MPLTIEAGLEHFDVSRFYEITLPPQVYSRLKIPAGKPYSSNREIFEDFGLRHLLCHIETETQKSYLNLAGHSEIPLSVTFDEKKNSLQYLKETIESFRNKIERRLKVSDQFNSALTFLLFSQKCKLKAKEREAFAGRRYRRPKGGRAEESQRIRFV
jgi:hypothetical protein